MGMRIACIDIHDKQIPKDKYDVAYAPAIIIDSNDVDISKDILKKASDKRFRYEYRELILYSNE